MEVTRKNFQSVLPEVEKAIAESDFLSVDTEFSGLHASSSYYISPLDTPEERYQKLRKGSCDFLVFQVGLCTFCFNKENNKYEARPFNFYVFPRPYSRAAPDCRFMCQSSSIDFLASQNFDFNKVFKEGIPYLTSTQESQLKDSLEEKHKQYNLFSSPAFVTPDSGAEAVTTKGPINIPEEHKDFIEGICKTVQEFLDKEGEETLSLPPCNGFVRKLIYQTVKQRFQSGIHLAAKTDEKKQRFIVVTRIKSEDDMKIKEQEKQAAELAEVEGAVGFSKVIRMITHSEKLVVGHNMFMDVIHLLHRFCSPLPENYLEFKALTTCIFPKLLDTKLMANTTPCKEFLPNTVLGDLLKHISCSPFEKPEIVFPENFPQYKLDDSNLHEAAYDAFITGMCFIGMSNFLGNKKDPPVSNVSPDDSVVKPFTNKLFLMRVPEIPYLDLAADDVLPNREHIFHVTFPKEWKAPDLYQLFSPFGNVNIQWLDDTSAFVSLYKKEQSSSGVHHPSPSQYQHIITGKRDVTMLSSDKKVSIIPHQTKRCPSSLTKSISTYNNGQERCYKVKFRQNLMH
ncbi:poly(A)-specific ribonuclease PARN-like isoform X2 [Ostrea edulis]|uniref:poly(A)-specific ribonuclease PARN-like isoform X2 n=1 Tax=Ostrea edulis TaxID=37623 RepID=UPI0024AECDD6|nr:poly(A)-specific ribonuclease PARN-like isoform X2 [Ostrea edulis]